MGGRTGSVIFLITKRGAEGGGCEEKRGRGEQKGRRDEEGVVTFYSVAAPTVPSMLLRKVDSVKQTGLLGRDGVFLFSVPVKQSRETREAH